MAEKVEDEAGRRGGRGDNWGEKYTQLSGFSIKKENNLINR